MIYNTGRLDGYVSCVKETKNTSWWAQFCQRHNIPTHIWLPILGYTRVWAEHYYRYAGDTANHGAEATKIFFHTIFHRIKSIFDAGSRYFPAGFDKSTIYAKDAIQPHEVKENVFSTYWVGHATQIYTIPYYKAGGELSSFTVVTDPVQGHLNFFLYPRLTREGVMVQEYPQINVIFLSHAHRDHCDEGTLRLLLKTQRASYNSEPVVLTTKGSYGMLKAIGFRHVIEMLPGDYVTFENNSIRIVSVDSLHWANMCSHDAHTSAFHGACIGSNALSGSIYFAGDTALPYEWVTNEMTKHCGRIACSMQPGGPDGPWMETTHQSSAAGLLMHMRLLKKHLGDEKNYSLSELLAKPLHTVYMHTKTFKLGAIRFNDTDESIARVLNALRAIGSLENIDIKNNPACSALTAPEEHVVHEILKIASTIMFRDDNGVIVKGVPAPVVVKILEQQVRIPKIGERVDLDLNAQADGTWHHGASDQNELQQDQHAAEIAA